MNLDAARAHFTQGLAALQAGRLDEAETALRAALALLPGRPSTLLNLAVTLLRAGRPAEALPLLDQVLAQDPADADALGHLGVALNGVGRTAEALQVFERLLQGAPERPEAWFHHAQSLQALDRNEAALQSYDRCLALQPGHARAWSQRGVALQQLGRNGEAEASLERALALGDDAELNGYYLAALRGGTPPAAAPRGYVEPLFDDYAADFERHLVETLGYDAPEVLQRLLLAHGRLGLASALDLGCGTGLCGPMLRPLLAEGGTLAGVDLSAAMLAVARERGVYDELLQQDLVEHLHGTRERHELVLAADVLIYLGDLAPVFAGVRRVLRPGGLFAFTVEAAAGDAGYVLQPSLRYAHGERQLLAWAEASGLRLLRSERGTLRADIAATGQGRYLLFQAD